MSRHTDYDEPATSVLRIRVTPTQQRELEVVARENQTTISAMIRDAVNEYVADYREDVPFRGNRRTEPAGRA